jgi:hypothetical protein
MVSPGETLRAAVHLVFPVGGAAVRAGAALEDMVAPHIIASVDPVVTVFAPVNVAPAPGHGVSAALCAEHVVAGVAS